MPKAKPLPDQKKLKRLLNYDPETGVLTWKARTPDMFREPGGQKQCDLWNAQYAGKVAATSKNGKYARFKTSHVQYQAHRIIWKLMTGEDPIEIDHIDGDGLNNTWINLRSVDRAANCRNRQGPNKKPKSIGLPMGVTKSPTAYTVIVAGKYIGSFRTSYEARAAAKVAYKLLGFHPNHGRPPGKHKI
jgi:hypothetical protein